MLDVNRFEDFCYKNNILITIVDDLSTKTKGFCYYDGAYYNVVLNKKYSRAQLKKTTIHEIIHIMENHFNYDIRNIEKAEKEVRLIIRKMQLN